MSRRKYLASQLGKKIQNPGSHMAHAAVMILRKKRKKHMDKSKDFEGGSKVPPIKEYDPFPLEYEPQNL